MRENFIQGNRFLDQSAQAEREMQKRTDQLQRLQAEHPGQIEIFHDQVLVAENASPELVQAVQRAMFGKIECPDGWASVESEIKCPAK